MIKNKLVKYSNEPIPINNSLQLHHILVSDIIENGEEWFLNLISPFKLSKKHFVMNIVSDEIMNKIIYEYNDFKKLENNLTDEILGELTQNEITNLYNLRMEFNTSRYSSISESELESISLLELLFRNYIIEKNMFNMDHMELLEKVVESLKYLFRVDNLIIDEENMILVAYENDEQGENKNKVIIDGELFDEICEYVLMINCEEKSKVEPTPIFKDEKTRLEYEELMAERKKIEAIKQKNEKFSAFNYIYSYVVHSDNGDYDRYLKYSYYRLMDRYRVLMNKESYEHNLRMMGVVSDVKDLDLKHWIEKLKERNNK